MVTEMINNNSDPNHNYYLNWNSSEFANSPTYGTAVPTSGWDHSIYEEIRSIDHIVEGDEGIIGVLKDGTKVRLDGFFNNALGMRIRYFLERIAAADEIDEDTAYTLVELKELLKLEEEELELAKKRIAFCQQMVKERVLP